jgi:hypothetical protein
MKGHADMPIWIVTVPEGCDAAIPFDFVDAPTANDALILTSSDFDQEDWPSLEAFEVTAGLAVSTYARLNREYKDEKRPSDKYLADAHGAALDEWWEEAASE